MARIRARTHPVVDIEAAHGSFIESAYNQYASMAFSLACRILGDRTAAEEVVLESFVTLSRRIQRPGQRGSHVGSLVMNLVRQRSIERLKGQDGQKQIPDQGRLPSGSSTSNGADDVFSSVQGRDVRDALAQLPRDQREALDRAYFRGASSQEISQQSGVPVSTVHEQLRLGLRAIRANIPAMEE